MLTNTPANQDMAQAAGNLDSLFDMVMNGGPVMIPIGLCSIVALTYTVERALRLSSAKLGSKSFGASLLAAVRDEGVDAGVQVCENESTPLARIFREGLKRSKVSSEEMEKAVEDAGAREIGRMGANLRPLAVVAALAPLLGLLGTVWGLIQAFAKLAMADSLGKPELLAGGVSQALVTTAAGLAIAIPTHAAYFYFKSRIDRFTRRTEDIYVGLTEAMATPGGSTSSGGSGGASS